MTLKRLICCIALLASCNVMAADSSYTPLGHKNCHPIDNYAMQCEGMGGYKLIVLDDDNRVSLDVITPASKKFSLNFWTTVTSSFSTLSNKAEWRIHRSHKKTVPYALIIRVHTSSLEAVSMPAGSFLVIIKLQPSSVCITNIIPGDEAHANTKARALADEIALNPSTPCRQ